MFRYLRILAWVSAAMVFAGCASKPQLPVDLAPTALSATPAPRVGVATTPLPAVDLHLPGADCLLCYIAARAMNAGIGKHVETLNADELAPLKEMIAAQVRRKGGNPVILKEPLAVRDLADRSGDTPNLARKNFTPLRDKHGIDKLIVVDIEALGIQRNYSSYIPNGAPHAVLRGRGYMVDLATNSYEWYRPLTLSRSSDGNWDEPPRFPGLTNAYFQTLEEAKDALLAPWRP